YKYPEGGDWRATEPIWQKDYKTSRAGSKHYSLFTPMLEEESRAAFVEALKLAGLDKQTANEKPKAAEAATPSKGKASLDELMTRVDFVAQFGVIHQLHAQIGAEGESPELVQKLARAYAQLSLLTGHT